MGRVRVRHLVQKPSGFYFQATPKMKAAGIVSEGLGKDPAIAIKRAEHLNSQWDEIRLCRSDHRPQETPGTFNALISSIQESSEYRDKKPRTKEEFDYAVGIAGEVFGPVQVSAITPDRCRRFYDKLRTQGSVHKAAKVAKWLRYSLGFAERAGLIASNPARSFKIRHPAAREALWRPDQIRAVMAKAYEEGRPCVALAVQIAYDTALRQGDILALTWGQFADDRLMVKQGKTGKALEVPISEETGRLIRISSATIPLPTAPIIRGPHGRAYKKDNFVHRFRDICRAAEVPDNLQFLDIRRTVATELAASGATAAEIAAATGHSIGRSQKILDTYVKTGHDMAAAAQRKRNRSRPKV